MSMDQMVMSVPAPGESTNAGWLRALAMSKAAGSVQSQALPLVVEQIADRFGEAPALLGERESLSFRELVEQSNRYARWALQAGVTKQQVVCLLMPNCPQYMAIWLGITRAGGVVALLNTNLLGSSLAHCIDIVTPAHIIVAREMMAILDGAREHLTTDPSIWVHGGGQSSNSGAAPLDCSIRALSGARLSTAECKDPPLTHRALLIYTSGTTGLPKAANVSHQRLLTWSFWFAGMMNTRSSDRMYNCLPMYHSIGGVVATGAVLVQGGSVVIRENFSVTRFWDDVIRYDCTLFQYIGELCRYLVLASPHPRERDHRIRLCCGNGLRSDIWRSFKERFRIPRILEFYAATEGNVTLFNCEGKPGAIGRVPSFLAHRSRIVLVQYDIDKGAIVRDRMGRPIQSLPGDVGLAIGRVFDLPSNPGARFEGYTNSRDSEAKILRNLFEIGDAWFVAGDLMRKDQDGFFYFVDRAGDTFRWKGENVATTEIEQAITAYPDVAGACVYGVEVPGAEGRAGMASLVVNGELQLREFREHLEARLPHYACPLFLRIVGELEITRTFKQKKGDLIREGYDPRLIKDDLYFNCFTREAFVPLSHELFDRIQRRELRL